MVRVTPPIRLATPQAQAAVRTTTHVHHEQATRRPGTSSRLSGPGFKLPQTTTTQRTSLPQADLGVEDRRSTCYNAQDNSGVVNHSGPGDRSARARRHEAGLGTVYLKSQKTSGKKSQANQRRGGFEKSARHKYLVCQKQSALKCTSRAPAINHSAP